MTISPKRLKQLQNLPDSEIDTSDIPELGEQFWQNARKVESVSKETVTISLDQDVLDWLRYKTPHYQALINQVLRTYMSQE